MGVPCMAFLFNFFSVFSCLVDVQFRVERSWVVRGLRNPEYGVLLSAASRAMGRRDWKLECVCISNVKSYLWAEGGRKGI